MDLGQVSTVPVRGGELAVRTWPGDIGVPTVVAAHGITGNSASWFRVAHHLAGRVSLVAPDLRGRVGSEALPGPWGMRAHAADVLAVADHRSLDGAVYAGHSMGTWVVSTLATVAPDRVDSLLLVDGGVPLPVPPDLTPDEVIDAVLGPAVARLRMVHPSVEAYRELFEAHPAFVGLVGGPALEAITVDLAETEGGYRTAISEAAVRADGTELLVDDQIRTALDRLAVPHRLIRAEKGLFDEPSPLVPPGEVDARPHLDTTTVPGSNHYDILLGDPGAQVIADTLLTAATSTASGADTAHHRVRKPRQKEA